MAPGVRVAPAVPPLRAIALRDGRTILNDRERHRSVDGARGWFSRVVYPRLWRLHGIVSPRSTLGVRALVTDGRSVCLVRHTYLPGFMLPGGAVDPGESAHEAVSRELLEEAGVAVGAPGRLFHLYWNAALEQRDHVALYVIRDFSILDGHRPPEGEIAEAGFFPLDRLPGETTPATRARLREVIEGEPPSDHW